MKLKIVEEVMPCDVSSVAFFFTFEQCNVDKFDKFITRCISVSRGAKKVPKKRKSVKI